MKKDNKFSKVFFSVLLLVLVFSGTGSTQNAAKSSAKPELLFQSGFEGKTKVVPHTNGNHKLIGGDKKLKYSDWSTDVEKRARAKSVYINYTGGDSTKRFAKIIPEPGNPKNKVLQFWLNEPFLASENQEKARVQVDFYGIEGGYKEFYQSVRVFLTEDFEVLKNYPRSIGWLTISEFWNNEWWVKGEKYGFRITLGIGKPSAECSELNFILNAENPGQIEIWEGHNTSVKVPIGKWFTMDYYVKEGNDKTGRFYMAITPEDGPTQVVFDVQNYTHMTKDPAPNGFTGYNPMKLYTSKELVSYVKSQGKTLQIYWDDFKLWTNKRP
jgi:hypothetical protein